MVLSEDTAGLDMHGCECSEVSIESRAGWLQPLWIKMCPFPLPCFHIPFPRLSAEAISAHDPISAPQWLERRGAVVRPWKPGSRDDQLL